jgi:diguanylate cyclase (GGDEF)-like protein
MSFGRLKPIHLYCGAVSIAGLVTLVWMVAEGSLAAVRRDPVEFLIFAICVVLGELRPVNIRRGDGTTSITVSTTFAFALLLRYGTEPAMLIFAGASMIGDIVGRAEWWKVTFNAAQYALAMAACALLLEMTVGLNPGISEYTVSNLLWIAAGASLFFFINVLAIAAAVAIGQRLPVLTFLRQELLFQGLITGMLIAIAPIVAVVVEHAPALVPLVFAPMLVAYRTAVVSSEKEHQALHDALTGLPNRTLFFRQVQQAVSGARRSGVPAAVLIVDLDRFKEINDTLGHSVGDLLLEEVGRRLATVVEQDDAVARLGGDEFGVLLRQVVDRDEVAEVADRIVAALETPFTIANMRLDVGASVGSALFPEHGQDAATLIPRADIAMYVAKSAAGAHQVYSPVYAQNSPERLALVGELREALARGELVLYYQPKVAIGTNRLEGVEALVRWRHPQRGMVPPDEFIPLAERTGLIRPLTTLVIEQALAQCQRWHNAGLALQVAVNLSARIVQDQQLPDDLAGLLLASEVEPRWLKLELTESMVMEDRVRAVEVLDRLHAMGVGLSIDDFGTGYSSLAYLKRLPVEEIKIDKSFILNMAVDANDALIARSTVDLGHNLGLQVVAEGVETPEVLAQLGAMGCDVAQGYLISRPLPAEELTRWLTSWNRRHAIGTIPQLG